MVWLLSTCERLDLLVLDLDVDVLVDLVAADLVGRLDRLAGHVVDQLLAQPVAGLLVDLPERHPLAGGGGAVNTAIGQATSESLR